MSKKRKINPRRRPATQADVKKAKEDAVYRSIIYAKAMTFLAALDLGKIQPEDVEPIWDKTNYIAESLGIKGYTDQQGRTYIRIQDIVDTLVEDYGVHIGKVSERTEHE